MKIFVCWFWERNSKQWIPWNAAHDLKTAEMKLKEHGRPWGDIILEHDVDQPLAEVDWPR